MDRSLLPESKVKALCDKAREIMASEENVVEVRVCVCLYVYLCSVYTCVCCTWCR